MDFKKKNGSNTYYKPFRNGFYAIAEICKDRNHSMYEPSKKIYYSTGYNYYDINIDITHKSIQEMHRIDILKNYNAGNSLCAVVGKSEADWLKTDLDSENRIVKEIEECFILAFYDPLFKYSKTSIYDYLCKLDIIRCKCVYYDNDILLIAALEEEKYLEALFCIKCQMLCCLQVNSEDLQYNVNILTNEKIESIRLQNLVDMESILKQYDDIVSIIKENDINL